MNLAIGSLFLLISAQAESLETSFQQEYVYLSSQKESLHRQQSQMEASFKSRLLTAKAQVRELQRQVTHLAALNDERHEELMQLEKQKKEIAKRGTSLESTFKKATESVVTLENQLRFENTKDTPKTQPTLSYDSKMSDLAPLFAKVDELLRSAARVETINGYYLDGQDQLKKGKITRLGRVAAFLNQGNEKVILGPSGSGLLKALEPAQGQSAFFFDNMSEIARIQKAATFVERLADAGPIVFLSLMLMLVAGLFVVLVRI